MPLLRARAHEVRAWAASIASLKYPMGVVLNAAYWRSADVFISHYLRDIERIRDDGSSGLPSVVAAQTVSLRHC